MKKYRTWNRLGEIEEIEIIRETEKSVVISAGPYGERREMKQSDHMRYFDSWQEAQAFLIDREKDAIAKAKADMERHVAELEKIREMKP